MKTDTTSDTTTIASTLSSVTEYISSSTESSLYLLSEYTNKLTNTFPTPSTMINDEHITLTQMSSPTAETSTSHIIMQTPNLSSMVVDYTDVFSTSSFPATTKEKKSSLLTTFKSAIHTTTSTSTTDVNILTSITEMLIDNLTTAPTSPYTASILTTISTDTSHDHENLTKFSTLIASSTSTSISMTNGASETDFMSTIDRSTYRTVSPTNILTSHTLDAISTTVTIAPILSSAAQYISSSTASLFSLSSAYTGDTSNQLTTQSTTVSSAKVETDTNQITSQSRSISSSITDDNNMIIRSSIPDTTVTTKFAIPVSTDQSTNIYTKLITSTNDINIPTTIPRVTEDKLLSTSIDQNTVSTSPGVATDIFQEQKNTTQVSTVFSIVSHSNEISTSKSVAMTNTNTEIYEISTLAQSTHQTVSPTNMITSQEKRHNK